MSQSRNKGTDNRSAKKAPASKTVEKEPTRKRTGLLIAVLVIVVIGAIAAVSIYWTQVRPFQQTIIVVDDTSINMGYFLKRTRMVGGDPTAMLLTLTNELIIKKAAPQPPYNVKVTAEDIDETLREIARGESGTISDSEFREWYRQRLNESGLSDAEYRDLMYTTLLRVRLHMYLAERVSTVAEQVYLHAIFVNSYEYALEVRARWEAGEDFADLAREVSTDEVAAEHGGEIGWFPYGVLDDTFRWEALSLDVDEVSRSIAIGQAETEQVTYALIMVSEKADAREVDEDALAVLQGKALEDWLMNEMQLHKVEFHGFNNGYDSEINAWINWQLQRMAK